MRRGQSRDKAYLEAVAFLVFTGREGVAHAFLEASHADLAAWCRRGGCASCPTSLLGEDAAALVHDLTVPLGGDPGEPDSSA